jgi:hypothetical protein
LNLCHQRAAGGPQLRQSNVADLDLRIVEAGAFGEIGLEIR